MSISKVLLDYVLDADYHTSLEKVKYSTSIREIVTVGYMIKHYEKEKAANAPTLTA